MNNSKDKIDTNLELQHLTQHIKDTWVNIPNLDEVMKLAWDIALDKTKHMFDHYGFLDIIEDIQNSRKKSNQWKLPKDELAFISSYDAVYELGHELLLGSSQLERIIMRDWNYSNVCHEIESAIKTQYDIKKLKPLGWSKLSKNYSEYDGMEEYDQEAIDKKFNGINSGGVASGGFTVRTSLPQVMYDDKEQGRKPFHTLVGAIIGHAYAVSKRNTTLEMIDDINKITQHYSQPQFFEKIILDIDTSQFVKNKTLKALFAIMDKEAISQEEFDKIIKDSKEANQKFEALSPEDKKIELENRKKEFSKIMASFSFKDEKTPEEIAQEKQKINEQHALCMNILNENSKKKAKP